MNLKDFSKVAEEGLTVGQIYWLKMRTGAGWVEVQEKDMLGTTVEIKEGGFNPALKKFRKGDSIHVPNDSGTWYEAKG